MVIGLSPYASCVCEDHSSTPGVYRYRLIVYISIRQAQINEKFIMLTADPKKMYERDMITPAQIRAARALLGWKQTDLATESGVSVMSIKNIERGATDPRASTLLALQSSLERGGAIFLDAGVTRDGGPGVRLVNQGS
jgi:DNA-binding XRE family transcriptional regulator